MRTKFPSSVIVFGVVSNDGHVMPPHFFTQGLRVNASACIDAEIGYQALDRGRGPGALLLLTPPTGPKSGWLRIFTIMLSLACVLLALQICIAWTTISRASLGERLTGGTIIPDSLKAAIVDVTAKIEKDHLIRACTYFRSRVEFVIEAEGGFIE